jgi:hypothetical protein
LEERVVQVVWMNRLNLDGGVNYLVDLIKGGLSLFKRRDPKILLFSEREEVVLGPIEASNSEDAPPIRSLNLEYKPELLLLQPALRLIVGSPRAPITSLRVCDIHIDSVADMVLMPLLLREDPLNSLLEGVVQALVPTDTSPILKHSILDLIVAVVLSP